jgi:hypothetical protein
MGHTEMLLAVAGLTPEEVLLITQRLARGEGQSPAQTRALAFARALSLQPWALTDADLAELEADWGQLRAWQIVWWTARCHYMTRVADAFQLPLEHTNPFVAMPGAKVAR